VSLDVERGEMIALLESSGCGKTTLLRSIAGFVMPDEGSIKVADQDITHLPPEKRATAMMFQSYALWPHMTVAGNIGYGLRMRGWKREEIAALDPDRARLRHHEAGDRSQQRRLAAARASKERDHLTARDVETDAIEDARRAIADGQRLDRKVSRHHGGSGSAMMGPNAKPRQTSRPAGIVQRNKPHARSPVGQRRHPCKKGRPHTQELPVDRVSNEHRTTEVMIATIIRSGKLS